MWAGAMSATEGPLAGDVMRAGPNRGFRGGRYAHPVPAATPPDAMAADAPAL
jgi:hypothetical protein